MYQYNNLIIDYINMDDPIISFQPISRVNLTEIVVPATALSIKTVISPLGTYIFRYAVNRKIQQPNFLINIRTNQIIANITKTSLQTAIFSYDQTQIYFTNFIGISKINIESRIITPLVKEQKKYNKIVDMLISKDFRQLYYLNQSSLYAVNLVTNELRFSSESINSGECKASKFNIHQPTNTIITSSDGSSCFICKWKIKSNAFQLTDINKKISICSINEIVIGQTSSTYLNETTREDAITITKSKLNINGRNSLFLNLTTLEEIRATSQRNRNSNYAYLVPFHNYYVQYFYNDNNFWLYRDSLANSPIEIRLPAIVRSIQYSQASNQLLVFTKHPNPSSLFDIMTTYQMEFNCGSIEGTQAIVDDKKTCNCGSSQIFDRSELKCRPDCEKKDSKCVCPNTFAFNTFNLGCELDCKSIPNTLPIQSYRTTGNIERCACKLPYEWNGINQCSFIDCSLIKFSNSRKGETCTCLQKYKWNSQNRLCEPISQNPDVIQEITDKKSMPVGLVVFFVIFFIMLFLVFGLVFYCRKYCKKKQKQQEKNGNGNEQNEQNNNQIGTNRQLGGEVQSEQVLNNKIMKNGQNSMNKGNDKEMEEVKVKEQDNINNFSIDEDEQIQDVGFQKKQKEENEDMFTQINSNMDNPLQEE